MVPPSLGSNPSTPAKLFVRIVNLFKFNFFIKTQDWKRIPILTFFILFINKMINHEQSDFSYLTFVLFIPFLLFLPYIQYSVLRDKYIGFIDQWIAMKKTIISYVLYKAIAACLALLIPLMIFIIIFNKETFSFVFGYVLCLFAGGSVILFAGVVLGIFELSIIQLFLFIGPICIPYFLLTAVGLKTQVFPVLPLFGILFITVGSVVLIIDHVE